MTTTSNLTTTSHDNISILIEPILLPPCTHHQTSLSYQPTNQLAYYSTSIPWPPNLNLILQNIKYYTIPATLTMSYPWNQHIIHKSLKKSGAETCCGSRIYISLESTNLDSYLFQPTINIIGWKWVFWIKHNMDGSIDK